MAIQRRFLGWDTPMLPTAGRWLVDRYARGGDCDLSEVVAVTPGARAARRLLDLLVAIAQENQLTLIPPDILTAGALPERLYESRLPVANRLQSLLLRAAALRDAQPEALSPVVPHPPHRDDFPAWLDLATQLAQLGDELYGQPIETARVTGILTQKLSLCPDLPRWRALAQLEQAYRQQLIDHGLTDRNQARLDAVRENRCATDRRIVLIATSDLSGIAREMLSQVHDCVTSLIHAPLFHESGFDDWGCFVPGYWAKQPLALDPQQVRVVEREHEQSHEVLLAVEAAAGSHPAEQITVGLGDEATGPGVQIKLELAGAPARLGVGKSVAKTGPAALLASFAAFIPERRFDQFAALLRHPDLEAYLARHVRDSTPRAIVSWQSLLDRYLQDHLQSRLSHDWLGDPKTAHALKSVHDAVLELMPCDRQELRPLPHWAPSLAAMLQAVYGPDDLKTRYPDQAQLAYSLQATGEVLREIAQLPSDAVWTPSLSADQAIAVVLSHIAGQSIPEDASGPAIELLGWLELPLDDAPALIVTGMNEGLVPQRTAHETFLYESVRKALGLRDAAYRYARDLMSLHTITHSRPSVTLIASRRGARDEPLAPSRLLLAGDPQHAARLIQRFYHESRPGDDENRWSPWLINPSQTSRFTVPPPRPHEPLTRLAITAFRDYLDCPYRFYLKHVLRLRLLDDRAVEMDGGMFGGLAHEVLGCFGQSELATSCNETEIRDFLADQLQCATRRRFGPRPSTAVELQVHLLRARLEAFAGWQATQSSQGWHIAAEHIEKQLSATIEVDAQPFTVTGRIDRIDRHEDGRWRIIDYKTSDTAKTPDETHRRGPKGAKQWIDLQLPLYGKFAEKLGITGQVELGFVHLPRDLPQVAYHAAPWSPGDLDAAIDEARRVIRSIRAAHFWPPADPRDRTRRFDDGFGWVCMDGHDHGTVGRPRSIEPDHATAEVQS